MDAAEHPAARLLGNKTVFMRIVVTSGTFLIRSRKPHQAAAAAVEVAVGSPAARQSEQEVPELSFLQENVSVRFVLDSELVTFLTGTLGVL